MSEALKIVATFTGRECLHCHCKLLDYERGAFRLENACPHCNARTIEKWAETAVRGRLAGPPKGG